jgi:hypothetical protein
MQGIKQTLESSTDPGADQLIPDKDITAFKEDGREIVLARKGQKIPRRALMRALERHYTETGESAGRSDFAKELIALGDRVRAKSREVTKKVERENRERARENRAAIDSITG